MNDFIEFQAKTLDEAIMDACDYFNADREKLEIEILEDSKSGVFGIIGMRKAKIQARKASLSDVASNSVYTQKENVSREIDEDTKSTKPKAEKAARSPKPKAEKKAKHDDDIDAEKKEHAPKAVKQEKAERPPRAPKPPREERAPREPRKIESSLADLDQDLLINTSKKVVATLIAQIDSEASINAEVYDERVNVNIDSEDSGLLIGKEGQCLASLEYIAARIISKELDSYVRIQIEVGDYKSRQHERLHEFALSLADRVMATGKSASTKQLTAYQRRIIHMALQDMPEIQTRSIGEGASKRVVISRAKGHRA